MKISKLRFLIAIFVAIFASSFGQDALSSSAVDEAGFFIATNELETFKFRPFVDGRTGVLISVGPLRTRDRVAFGNFEAAYVLDRDRKAIDFSSGLGTMFYRDRVNFLEELTGSHFTITDLEAIRSGGLAEEAILTKAFDGRGVPVWLYDLFSSDVEKMIQTTTFFKTALLHLVSQSRRWDSSFLGNPAGYQKVQRFEADSNIHSVHGDLQDPDDFQTIADDLKRSGKKVSLVDISNAQMTFTYPAGFILALRKLVFTEDAILLMTIPGTDSFMDWEIKSIPVKTLLSHHQPLDLLYGNSSSHRTTCGENL